MKGFERKLKLWEKAFEGAAERLEQEAAQEGAELARRYAPVDSGALRNGIRAEGAAVISTAPHAVMVEFGTARSVAQPYMQPMAEAMRPRFTDLARRAAKEVLN